ncbi:MAG: sugar phosphate isomerase [Desulfobacterales bacterium C00003060]|nr:MAG: sugar phosphate isomerase [Desulfobacterales bacterium S3730MH5]OEU80167.1 MAG: sugar phosphate isomerase [Desulfobacterales bacterium C00003060]OEU82988.1 MAG: sugar phosphate isomerase [Desulfobacterales bacterium S5133MH4]
MKIGLMNNPSASIYDEIVLFGEAHYDFLDLTIEGPDALDPDPERVVALLDQYGLSVVGHTDPCLPYAYPIKSVRDACFQELERCAKIFSAIGATIMNIHPCYCCPPAMNQELVQLNVEALKPLQAMASSYGLILVLENFKAPFDSVSTFAKLMQEVPGLEVHLDLGHTNFGTDDGVTFCAFFGSHIKHVHFSDNRSTDDHHMPLGVGNVDWNKQVSALKSIGYDGTITLEVFCDNKGVLFQYLEISRRLVLDLWNQ